MRVYVQQLLEADRSYLSFEQIAHWFNVRGDEVIRFDYSELDQGLLDRGLLRFPDETIVAGSGKAIQDALIRAGRPRPVIHDLPDCLHRWIGRKFWSSTFAEVRSMAESRSPQLPLHIKPLRRAKLFTGKVIYGIEDLGRLGEVEDHEPLLVQERIELRSEWRAYVLRQKIVHIARYVGDPICFPDVARLQDALIAYQDQPVAFGMDWGVTSAGETLLIEINDGFALGNYGLQGEIHVAMIEARWRQLMGLVDNGAGETF